MYRVADGTGNMLNHGEDLTNLHGEHSICVKWRFDNPHMVKYIHGSHKRIQSAIKVVRAVSFNSSMS